MPEHQQQAEAGLGQIQVVSAGSIASGVGGAHDTIKLADINGDGLADYLIVDQSSGAVQAYLNGGPKASAPGGWLWYPQGTIASGVLTNPTATYVSFADINGDGKADYLIVGIDGSVSAYLNQGQQASAPNGWGWNPIGQIASGTGGATTMEFGDIDWDGRADYLAVSLLLELCRRI
jgi:hypothetical protein